MSYYTVKPPESHHRFLVPTLIGGIVLSFVFMALVGLTALRPVAVSVDGDQWRVPMGTTVGDLMASGLTTAKPGDLVGIGGSVVVTGGGEPVAFTRNGRAAGASQRVYTGDVVTSHAGTDKQESIITTDVPMPFEVREVGRGPLTELTALGAPGVRRVTRGEFSGFEITSTVVVEPADMVVRFVRPVTGKVVALTFDDGPFPVYTREVLKTLERHEVKATFFMLGLQVKRNPAMARRVVREGHAVGSHSFSHKPFTSLPKEQVRHELRRGRQVIDEATGVNSRWVRPPYGAMNSESWRQMRVMNVTPVMWDVDSRDWTKPGARKIASLVVRSVRPGSVVLMHDGGGNRRQTVQALNLLIPALKRRGYTFVTLDELESAKRAQREADAEKALGSRPAVKGKKGS